LEKRPDSQDRHCWGTGIKRAVFFQGKDYAPLDLFQMVAPGQWGVIYAIRTGPGDFNHLLVTSQSKGGACPLNRRVAGGRVWDTSEANAAYSRSAYEMPASKFARMAEQGQLPGVVMIPTPEEEDFFAALNFPLWPPKSRTEERLRAYLRRPRDKI
jgi:hypothetical protein